MCVGGWHRGGAASTRRPRWRGRRHSPASAGNEGGRRAPAGECVCGGARLTSRPGAVGRGGRAGAAGVVAVLLRWCVGCSIIGARALRRDRRVPPAGRGAPALPAATRIDDSDGPYPPSQHTHTHTPGGGRAALQRLRGAVGRDGAGWRARAGMRASLRMPARAPACGLRSRPRSRPRWSGPGSFVRNVLLSLSSSLAVLTIMTKRNDP